ncbi:MAG: phosphatase PAP2 family protein [Candidatus Zixiibacteriota bacterium]|nr:MAG: phosphatase PAP2 family protein [candidate division Zixibacteria bacterium]
MLETIQQLDQTLFLFFNSTLANPVTNFVMPIITNDWGLRILYGLAMIILLIKGDTRLRWLVLFSAVCLVLCDQISAGYLKPLIARPRPCHGLMNVNLLIQCGGGYSFPSAHTTNAFGQAVLFSCPYRKAGWYLYPVAALIGVSRIFVGVHYPGDVLGGLILGSLIGLLVFFGFTGFRRIAGVEPGGPGQS